MRDSWLLRIDRLRIVYFLRAVPYVPGCDLLGANPADVFCEYRRRCSQNRLRRFVYLQSVEAIAFGAANFCNANYARGSLGGLSCVDGKTRQSFILKWSNC